MEQNGHLEAPFGMSIFEWILGRLLGPSLGGRGGGCSAACSSNGVWVPYRTIHKDQTTEDKDNRQHTGRSNTPRRARGTVADIYIYIYIYMKKR